MRTDKGKMCYRYTRFASRSILINQSIQESRKVMSHKTKIKHKAMGLPYNKPHSTPTCEKKLFLESQHENAVVVHQNADCS